MSIFSYLRSRGLRDGLIRGRRGWLIVGSIVWGVRLLRRATRRSVQVVSTEKLHSGQSLSVSALEPTQRIPRRAR